jgi:hypothetical protein
LLYRSLSWWFSCRPLGCPGGLVVPGRVEGELAEELAGGGVDDSELKVLDDQQDAGPGVGWPDADVVQAAAGAQRDGARGVDAIGPEAIVGAGIAAAGGGLRAGLVSDGRGGPAWQPPPLVVLARERAGEGLELRHAGGLSQLGTEPFLETSH